MVPVVAVQPQAQPSIIGEFVGLAEQVNEVYSFETLNIKGKTYKYPTEFKIYRLNPHQQVGGSAYQSLQCKGLLTYLHYHNGWYYFFEDCPDRDRKGRRICDSMTVRVKMLDPNRMRVHWFRVDVGRPIVKATLVRKRTTDVTGEPPPARRQTDEEEADTQ